MTGVEAFVPDNEEVTLAETERQLAAAVRVAAEAMKMLVPEQLAELRHRLEVLEVGERGEG